LPTAIAESTPRGCREEAVTPPPLSQAGSKAGSGETACEGPSESRPSCRWATVTRSSGTRQCPRAPPRPACRQALRDGSFLRPRHRGRAALELAPWVVAAGMLHEPIDEASRMGGQEASRVPDDPAPHTEGCTGVQKGRCVDSSTVESDGRRHDGNTAAGLSQREQRLRVTGLEDDSRVDVGNAAGAVEHLPGAKSLS
jgi:hypothetical protein